MRYTILRLAAFALLLLAVSPYGMTAEKKKVVFVAGPQSHDYGSHEHYAGCMLLAKCLNEALPDVETVVHKNGWPKDPQALEGADTVVLFSDGGGGNPILAHLEQMDELAGKGVGLVCLHYAVQVDAEKPREFFKNWIGGYYELHWSVNPHWNAVIRQFPDHPILRGVRPFAIDDEWYYHMRFNDNMEGVTPILSAIPPDATRQRPDGPHSGNPSVRARLGMSEHVAWARQRGDGGRGFGFTGGHFHWNWASDNFRKVVLNGIAWTARIEIPAGGISSTTPTFEALEANQDFPPPANFPREQWIRKMQRWNAPGDADRLSEER